MKTIKGPAIFLAQYMGSNLPFDGLGDYAQWASGLGFQAVQMPTWESKIFDLELAATSQSYCDDLQASLSQFGLEISELSSHLQGQLVAVHPAYDIPFDAFAPKDVRGNASARTAWAIEQVQFALKASKNLGLSASATFSGALAWPYVYPWPPRPAGLIEEAFAELARRWTPILDCAEECGVDLCYEIHPGEDLHDGATWERFLGAVHQHPRANLLYDPSHLLLQGLDYLQFLDFYHERIKAFHVKDAELRCDGRIGVYGGYEAWPERAGRFRSLGDGSIDFKAIFTKLAHRDFPGWAVLEWECAFKDNLVGAAEGAQFIQQHIIEVAKGSFDDFAAGEDCGNSNRRMLGLDS